MIELFIENKKAVLPENVKFKVTMENVFFTKSGNYTYDIELPAKENFTIFGHINRLDTSTDSITYSAKLVVDNDELLNGKATLTSVSQYSIKVQLLAGNAQMNFVNNNEQLYIDEIDLGNWGREIQGNYYSGSGKGTTYSLFYAAIWNVYQSKWRTSREEAKLWLEQLLWGTGKYVAYPIYNESADTTCNDWVVRIIDNSAYFEPRWSLQQDFSDGSSKQVGNNYPQVKFALQPKLVWIIERLFEKLGYKVDVSELESIDLLSRIYITTANDRLEICKALPHWTVNDFITQIEKFLGIVVYTNGKEIRIIPRSKYNSNTYYIKDVVDEWSIDYDENDNFDSIGYCKTDVYSCIDNEIRELAKKKVFSSLVELQSEFSNNPNFCSENKGYILEVEGRYYIVRGENNTLREIDYLKPKQQNNGDVDFELKIVPCPMAIRSFDVVSTDTIDDVKIDSIIMTNEAYIMSREDLLSCTFSGITNSDAIEDVEAVINGNEELPEKNNNDIMYVALSYDHINTGAGIISYPLGVVHPLSTTAPFSLFNNIGHSLSINNIPGLKTLYSEVVDKEPKIIRNKKYCIRFISNKKITPDGVYIIRNRKFVCEKLEYSINTRGMEKLVTGYFYEMK